jgi:hypothetical protein
MTTNTKLVVVRVTKIRPIIVLMILGPQSGRTFRPAAGRNGYGIVLVDGISARSE